MDCEISFWCVSVIICYGLRNILLVCFCNYLLWTAKYPCILWEPEFYYLFDKRPPFFLLFIITRKYLVNCVGSVLSTARNLRTIAVWISALDSCFNTLNTELNATCHFLALLGAYHILHVSRIRVNIGAPSDHEGCEGTRQKLKRMNLN